MSKREGRAGNADPMGLGGRTESRKKAFNPTIEEEKINECIDWGLRERAQGTIPPPQDDLDGVREQKLREFLQKYGVDKPSKGALYVPRIIGKGTPAREYELQGIRGALSVFLGVPPQEWPFSRNCCSYSWLDDHMALWLRGGKPAVFTSQPYAKDTADFRDLISEVAGVFEEHGLNLEVDPAASWWFPGRTILIVVTKRGCV